MNADSSSTITLRASRAWKGWWIGTTVFMILIVILSMSAEILNYIWGIYMAIFFFFVGLARTSKYTNLKMSHSYLEGGFFFRNRTSWDQISNIYSDLDYLYWEEITLNRKTKTYKVPYEHWGRECRQNGKQVSKELALEWIQKLRKAKSVSKRIELIAEFATIRRMTKKEISELTLEEQKKAKSLLKKYNNAGGEYRMERRNEIRQYFEQKGWVLPQPKISKGKRLIARIFLFLLFGFWICFFIFAFTR
jgi:hypothetical protein